MDTFPETTGPSWDWFGLVGFFAGILIMVGGVVLLFLNLGPSSNLQLPLAILVMEFGGIVIIFSVFLMLGRMFLRR